MSVTSQQQCLLHEVVGGRRDVHFRLHREAVFRQKPLRLCSRSGVYTYIQLHDTLNRSELVCMLDVDMANTDGDSWRSHTDPVTIADPAEADVHGDTIR